MRTDWFIASRLIRNRQRSFSRFIGRIATIAIALSVAVMLLSNYMIEGFQREIKGKMFRFWGHIQLTSYDRNQSSESSPITSSAALLSAIQQVPGVTHIQSFATKPGIIKVNDQMEGMVLKGIGSDYDWSFIQQQLLSGDVLSLPADSASFGILISQSTARRLQLQAGDAVPVSFIDPETFRIRSRRFTVSGIYNTGMEEFDKLFALVDIRQIQKLNNWQEDQVGGYEVFIADITQLREMERQVYDAIPVDMQSRTIEQLQPTIFDWLELQSTNEVVILTLMLIVAVINMVTTLLILILERTNMIGILKAIGAGNGLVQRIFLWQAGYILLSGILLGNLFAIGLAIMQTEYGLISLPEETYYVSQAPIYFNWLTTVVLDAGTLLLGLLVMLLPSILITRIQPIKAIRFN